MDLLTLPVGTLARGFEPIHAEDSISRAVTILREHSNVIVPVTEDGRYIGVVSESSLARALAECVDVTEAVKKAVEPSESISTAASGAEALRRLTETKSGTLVVVNAHDEPVGIISASDLFPRPLRRPVPPLVGGMATPFGVYLTNGATHGGVSPLALISTGALLGFLLMFASVITGYAAPYFGTGTFAEYAIGALPLVIFMVLMRALPLAGTHAAEHMVVHALERGEPLIPSVVKRMPRVHPRCGTNLAVGISMFLALKEIRLGLGEEAQTLIAALVTFMTYKNAGGFVQWLITTKPPTDRQIKDGIFAAEDLLKNYGATRLNHPTFLSRLVNMGIFQVMLGALAVAGLSFYLAKVLHLPGIL